MIESIESKTPPRPGINEPLSFTSQERLITDSIKSPTIAPKEVRSDITTIFQYAPTNTCGKIILNKIDTIKVPTTPPINPTRLLFGLAATIPLVPLPNKKKKSHAKESVIKTIMKNKARK